jgi:spermidine export protein MdtJ
MARAWGYLILAIVTEVAGTLAMNSSGHSGNPWMYAVMFVFICTSYILLSFALRKIAVGIAIAIWEGFGTALISTISIVFLHERASPQKILGLILALLGIALMHFGEAENDASSTPGTGAN